MKVGSIPARSIMQTCKKHPHSSPETARKCYEQAMRKSVDRKMKHYGTPQMSSYEQVKFDPPQVIVYPIGTVYAFFGAVKKNRS